MRSGEFRCSTRKLETYNFFFRPLFGFEFDFDPAPRARRYRLPIPITVALRLRALPNVKCASRAWWA